MPDYLYRLTLFLLHRLVALILIATDLFSTSSCKPHHS